MPPRRFTSETIELLSSELEKRVKSPFRLRDCGPTRWFLDLGPDHGEQISLARVARGIERMVRAEVLDA
jgi:hypothetical protein